MKVHLPNILPANFNKESKVWIYQADRIFTMPEIFKIEPHLENFADNWTSHGARVKGFATVLYGQFIIIMADETATTVGGCSTDSSVHVIKEIEQMTGVKLFNRELLAFWVKDKVQTIPMAQVGYALENGLLQNDTLYFNNLVNTKADMEANWLQPISESWLAKKYIK
ncbi:MAG: hypothetical protein ACOVJ8_11395 [Sediminibacterium sp.]